MRGCSAAKGMRRVGEYATLNANYLAERLAKKGFDLAYPKRRASHEFIVTVAQQKKDERRDRAGFLQEPARHGHPRADELFPVAGARVPSDRADRDRGKEKLDEFVEALVAILKEAEEDPELVKGAPHTMPVRRLDDVKAARDLDLRWKSGLGSELVIAREEWERSRTELCVKSLIDWKFSQWIFDQYARSF